SGSDTSITPPTATTTPKTIVAVTPKLTVAAKGKHPAKAKSLSDPSEVARTKAQQLKIVLKRSRQQTHISQPGGSGTDEGTSSKPRVLDVPTNDEGADDQVKDKDDDEGDEGDESDEGEEDADEDKEVGVAYKEYYVCATREAAPKPKASAKKKKERMQEEEDVEELYRDVDINQGRGLQVSQETEDSHTVKSFEDNFSNIPGIVNQYMHQLPEAVRE
nr:hypothetical protein [Tanacetum cinerariifolium]